MKLIDIFKSASGNMVQSKLRTALTIIAVFIGAFTLTLTTAIGNGISGYIDKQVANVGAKDLLIIQAQATNAFAGLTGDAPKEYDPERKLTASSYGGPAVAVLTPVDIEKIRATEHLSDVRNVQIPAVDYIVGPNAKKYQTGVDQYWDDTNLDMGSGTEPNNHTDENQLSLPSEFVTVLGFADFEAAVGQTVSLGITAATGEIFEIKATISGVQLKSLVAAGGANLNQALSEALYDAQSVGLPDSAKEQYSFVVARYDTSISADQLTALKKSLQDSGYTATTVEDQIGIFKQVISGVAGVFTMFGAIALLAAAFGVINTLFMAVQERTREIGLMKAIGMSGNRIFLLFSIEAVLLGFWGSLLGVLAALGTGSIVNQVASSGFLKDFEGLELLVFPIQSIVIIMLIIMLIAFLAGTLPARRAGKLDPIDALRYE